MSGQPSDDMPAVVPLRILVVEDHPALREALCRYLTRLGHQVQSTTMLATALCKLQSEAVPSFQLLIVDMDLPDGSGIDLLAAVPPGCGFVTCSGFPQQLPTSRVAPWLAHLEKPFHINELAMALKKAAAFVR